MNLEIKNNPFTQNEQSYWIEVGQNQGWLTLDVDPKYVHQLNQGKSKKFRSID